MNKILVIGSISHEKIDNIEWTEPFCDIEKYDSMIIDLTSFPKDYPRTLFTNIGVLKRTARLFIRDNKEIFCIMDKPFKVLFKEIPLNYAWIPFPQKLTVNTMLLGKTINVTDERFADYLENVVKWDNELTWKNTDNISFGTIAVNKVQNPIAATITMINRGKIHFLPKTPKSSQNIALELLIELATNEEKEEYQWLDMIESPEPYRNLFSVDDNKVIKAVYLILKEFGITTTQNTECYNTNFSNRISVQIISTKGKVEAKNTKITKIARFIDGQRNIKKIIFVANTYQDLPINNRTNNEHIDLAMKLFFETNNTLFLTTLSLHNLWKKVVSGHISANEAASLIKNKSGEIKI